MNVFADILATVQSTTKNNLQNSKNRTRFAIKLVSKMANESFNPYLGNGIFHQQKISKVLKIDQQIP